MKLIRRHVDLEHRDVGRGVLADDLRAHGLGAVLVAERDLDLVRAVHDVGVGEDVPGVVDHEAGAGRRVPTAAAEGVRGARGFGACWAWT